MQLVVNADKDQKKELLAQGLMENIKVTWLEESIAIAGIDCYIDLLFAPTAESIENLQQLQPALIIVNDVISLSNQLPANVVRINGWKGFLERPVVEACTADSTIKKEAEHVFSFFNKTTTWVPDSVGLISPRVVSMIINEAYLALEEGVSTKEEIDIAMKLGTNYPYGPFEWGEKIGIKNVYDLLYTLAQKRIQYEPATLIKKEALAQ